MKIVMIYDQIQSGAGTKDDKMVELNIKKELVGPSIMMEPFLKEIGGNVVATLYCGNGYYVQNKEDVIRKLTAMSQKLGADVVMCGPSFNYLEYSQMSAEVAKNINEQTSIKAFAAMSEENEETIEKYKDIINIVKTPKKGGIGLSESLKNMCNVAKCMFDNNDIEDDDCF